MKFFDLLNERGFNPPLTGKILQVRHMLNPNRVPAAEAEYVKRSASKLEEWQCIQCKVNPDGGRNDGALFWKCRAFFAFCGPRYYGEDNAPAQYPYRFAGVFLNTSNDEPQKLDIDRHLTPELAKVMHKSGEKINNLYFFNFQKDRRFEDLEGRVFVDWDRGQSWVKTFNPNTECWIADSGHAGS